MTEQSGTYVVTHTDEETAVLQDPSSGQVHTLDGNPGVERGEIVEATIESVPPMDAVWRVTELRETRSVTIGRSPEPPTNPAKEAAADQAVGELTRIERAGTGELHVITVPGDGTEQAVEDVLADEEGLLARAARLGVNRVEVRAEDGVLSVRYLP